MYDILGNCKYRIFFISSAKFIYNYYGYLYISSSRGRFTLATYLCRPAALVAAAVRLRRRRRLRRSLPRTVEDAVVPAVAARPSRTRT